MLGVPKEDKLMEKPNMTAKLEKTGSSSVERALMQQYATSDQPLNEHVFGNIKLKYVDFSSPKVYKLFEIKKPDTKRQAYL